LVVAASSWSTGSSLPASVTATQLAGNHKLYLDAAYNQKVLAIEAYAYADVANGTAAVLQANGPASWSCPGVFASHAALGGNDFRDLPYFKLGSSTNVHFTGPPGEYTITVSIPSQKASVSRKITAGPMAKDGTGSYSAPAGCVSTPPP
jgi:hypothetical protein